MNTATSLTSSALDWGGSSVIAFDGGFIGVTAVDGHRLGQPVPADRLLQQPERGLCVPVLRQQKVHGLAVLIHGAIEIVPLAFDLHVGLVHAPADPHRTFPAMKRLFQQGTVFHHPALDSRMVDRYAALLHEFFYMPVAQGIGHVPPHPHENDVLWEMGSLEADRHHRSPSLLTMANRRRSYLNGL